MERNVISCGRWGKALLALCTIAIGAGSAAASSQKISADLDARPASDQVDVIVQFNQVPGAAHHRRVMSLGGTLKRTYSQFKGAVYTVPVSKLADLAADPDVVYVSPDRPLSGAGTSLPANDYHPAAINGYGSFLNGLTGSGIGVALIDSGIAPNSDINASKIVAMENFTGHGTGADEYGHGTHVAGILAGDGAASSLANDYYTFKGIAVNASLIDYRVLDENGEGTDSEAIAAIDEAINVRYKYNIRVINLSLGRPVWESYKQDPLCQAVEAAWKAGIVVVVAAGNYGRDNNAGTHGYGTITAPANDPYVITVGAMNTRGTVSRTDDVIASYSSKGPTLFDQVVKPDLVAPGNRVISLYNEGQTLSDGYPGNVVPIWLYEDTTVTTPSDNYFFLSGTSMAAPMVSGAAAILLQQNPSLTPDQVKARLMKTAFKTLVQQSTATDPVTGITYSDQADIFTVGAGYLDIAAALANTDLAPSYAGSALSPNAWVDSGKNVVMSVDAQSVLGGSSVLWGSSAVWGSSVLWGKDTNGESVLWGSTSLQGQSVLWGKTTNSADSVLWGASVVWGSTELQPDLMIYGDN